MVVSEVHGIVLKGLKDFVTSGHDHEAWVAIQREAGLEGQVYVPVTEYEDTDVLGLVAAASEVTGTDASVLLDEFGRFLVPPLVETYGVHVDEDWTGLELIANTETYIHEALRAKQLSTYTPPDIIAQWVSDDTVRVVYGSERQLCSLARGLIHGVGSYYGEQFQIVEETCMHEGGECCEIIVTSRPST